MSNYKSGQKTSRFFHQTLIEGEGSILRRTGTNVYSPVNNYLLIRGSTTVDIGGFPLRITGSLPLAQSGMPKSLAFVTVSVDQNYLDEIKEKERLNTIEKRKASFMSIYGRQEVGMAMKMKNIGLIDTSVSTSGYQLPSVHTPTYENPEVNPLIPETGKLKTPPVDSISLNRADYSQRLDSLSRLYPGRESEVKSLAIKVDSLCKTDPHFLHELNGLSNLEKYSKNPVNPPGFNKPEVKMGTFIQQWSDHTLFITPFCGLYLAYKYGPLRLETGFSYNPFTTIPVLSAYRNGGFGSLSFESKNGKSKGGFRGSLIELPKLTIQDSIGPDSAGISRRKSSLVFGLFASKVMGRWEISGEVNRSYSSNSPLLLSDFKQLFESTRFSSSSSVGNAYLIKLAYRYQQIKAYLSLDRVDPRYYTTGNIYLWNNWEKVETGLDIRLKKPKIVLTPYFSLGQVVTNRYKGFLSGTLLYGLRSSGGNERIGYLSVLTLPVLSRKQGTVSTLPNLTLSVWTKHYWGKKHIENLFSVRSGWMPVSNPNQNRPLESREILLRSTLKSDPYDFYVALLYRQDEFDQERRLFSKGTFVGFGMPLFQGVRYNSEIEGISYISSGYLLSYRGDLRIYLSRKLNLEVGFKYLKSKNLDSKLNFNNRDFMVFSRVSIAVD